MKSFSAKLGQLIVPSSFVVRVYLLACILNQPISEHAFDATIQGSVAHFDFPLCVLLDLFHDFIPVFLTRCEGEKDRKHGRSKRRDVFDCLHILSIGPKRTYVKFKGLHISRFFRVTLEALAFFGRMMEHLRSEMSTFRHRVFLSSRGYHGNHRKTVAKKALAGKKVELAEEVKELLKETVKALKGSARRLFMARTVRALGEEGQRLVERELGWNRGTIRKGLHERERGIVCLDVFSARGRKRREEHLPNLLRDITAIVDGQSQADPQFRTKRLYTRLTVTEVRRQLIAQFGYCDDELPTAETIVTKLNNLEYYPKKVAKSQLT